jgi:murein DD-endopeptidase MepM/ murein hydrolase activator NlpD
MTTKRDGEEPDPEERLHSERGLVSRRAVLGLAAVGAGFALSATGAQRASAAVPFSLANPYTRWELRDDFYAHVARSSQAPGLDYGLPVGQAVAAPAGGSITYVLGTNDNGWYATIVHPGGWKSRFLHLSGFAGGARTVAKGEIIAYSGGAPGHPGAGSSTGAHLHWSLINPAGTYVDPLPQINSTVGSQPEEIDMPTYELVRGLNQAAVWFCVDRIHRYAIPNETVLADYQYFMTQKGQPSTVQYPVNLTSFGTPVYQGGTPASQTP